MSLTVEYHEGSVTYLSDEGMRLAAADREEQQRLARVDRLYTEIRIGSILGAVLVIAVLAITKILGA